MLRFALDGRIPHLTVIALSSTKAPRMTENKWHFYVFASCEQV